VCTYADGQRGRRAGRPVHSEAEQQAVPRQREVHEATRGDAGEGGAPTSAGAREERSPSA